MYSEEYWMSRKRWNTQPAAKHGKYILIIHCCQTKFLSLNFLQLQAHAQLDLLGQFVACTMLHLNGLRHYKAKYSKFLESIKISLLENISL